MRIKADGKRAVLCFGRTAQRSLRIVPGQQVIATTNENGNIIITKVPFDSSDDTGARREFIGLRVAQQVNGMREVASWNLLLKSVLRLQYGTAEPYMVVPTPLAAEFAWWLRWKMFRERKLMQKRIGAEAPGPDVPAQACGADRICPQKLKAKG